MVKNCDLGLEMLPSAYGYGQYFQDLVAYVVDDCIYKPIC